MRGLMIQSSTLPNQRMRKGKTASLAPDGRIYYLNHVTRSTSWLPPIDSWNAGDPFLPYGWEIACDSEGKNYYINHLNKTTTYEDPRKDDDDPPPQPREVELFRHPECGFGFVAGSEKPVIVRSVKEGGPSDDKLLPGDQILKINGIDMVRAPRDEIIEMVKSCQHSVRLTVCQPYSTRKSAILTAAKKAKLKSNPSRVRFAEGVAINGSPLYCTTPFESAVPFMPNVLKVFLENGQTKTFKYDSSITVQDVLNSLVEKLDLRCSEYYSLCTEHVKSIRRNKLTILDPKDTLSKIAARPGAHNLRCLFRMTFVPRDINELFKKDPNSFEYLYGQCCNDVVQERFTPELKYETALRLCALHLYKHALVNGLVNSRGKVNLKALEKEYGLEPFVPYTLAETMKRKQLRKYLSHSLKQNRSLIPSGQKHLTEDQTKIHFLSLISELPCFGAKLFSTNIRDLTADLALLISPKYGISHVTRGRHSSPITLAKIEDVTSIRVTKDDDLSFTVEIQLKGSGTSIETSPLHFALDEKDTEEFTLVLNGYHKLLAVNNNSPTPDTDPKEIPIYWDVGPSWWTDSAPSYHGKHLVKVAPWSYPISTDPNELRMVNLSLPPPCYSPNDSLYSCYPSNGSSIGSGPGIGSMIPITSDSHHHHHPHLDHNMNNSSSSHSSNHLLAETSSSSSLPSSPLRLISSSTTTTSSTLPRLPSHTTTTATSSASGGYNLCSNSFKPSSSLPFSEDDLINSGLSSSEEIMRRVMEMNKIISDAENYLNQSESLTACDNDSPTIVDKRMIDVEDEQTAPQLKAADSLLFLTHIDDSKDGLDKSNAESVDDSPCESDTDVESLITINGSLSHVQSDENSTFLRTETGLDRLEYNNSNNIILSNNKVISNNNNNTIIINNHNNNNGNLITGKDNPNGNNNKVTIPIPGNSKGSSFGLHSPDVIPTSLSDTENDLIETLKALQNPGEYQVPFSETTLYLDRDIIDLTTIPPPKTPDLDLSSSTPSIKSLSASSLLSSPYAIPYLHSTTTTATANSQLDNPPTSYVSYPEEEKVNLTHYNNIINSNNLLNSKADSSDEGHCNIYNNLTNSLKNHLDLQDLVTPEQITAHCSLATEPLSSDHQSLKEMQLALSNLPNTCSPVHLDNNHSSSIALPADPVDNEILKSLPQDIDKFIATVSVPPPTATVTAAHHPCTNNSNSDEANYDNGYESNKDDCDYLSSLIIPPPPTSSPSFSREQDAIIARFWKATDAVRKVCNEKATDLESSPRLSSRGLHSSSSGDSGYDSIVNSSSLFLSSSSTATQHQHQPPSSNEWSSTSSPNLIVTDPQSNNSQKFFVLPTVEENPLSRANIYPRMSLPNEPKSSPSATTTITTPPSPGTTTLVNNSSNPSSYLETLSSSSSLIAHDNATQRISESSSCDDLYRLSRKTESEFICRSSDESSDEFNSLISKPMIKSYSWTSLQRNNRTCPASGKPPLPPYSASRLHGRRRLLHGGSKKLAPLVVTTSTSSTLNRCKSSKLNKFPVELSSVHGQPSEPHLTDLIVKEGDEVDLNDNHQLDCLISRSGLGLMNSNDRYLHHFHHHIHNHHHHPVQSSSSSPTTSSPGSGSETSATTPTDNLLNTRGKLEDLFIRSQRDIDILLVRLEEVHEARLRSQPLVYNSNHVEKYVHAKETLLLESRSFVTTSKLFVKCATDSSPQLIDHLLTCITSLGRMFDIGESIVIHLQSQAQTTCLVDRLKEVAATFGYTVNTVHKLINGLITTQPEPSSTNSYMGLLINHAGTLATSLSALMRTLRALD